MSRRLSLVVISLAGGLSLLNCNNVTCGAGTMQVQQKDGTLKCLPVDGTPQTVNCDLDGGAAIVGGVCTSAIKCGAGTTLINGECIGTGGAPGTPPPCPTPSSNSVICVNGAIHDLVGNALVTESVHVAYYSSPLNFLSGMPADKELDTTDGTFVFQDVTAPSPALPLIAVAFGDADIATKTNAGLNFVATGAGAQNVLGGKSYRVDGFTVKRTVVDSWKTPTGVDWFANGGFVARFFNDPAPPATNLAFTETHPVMGVQLTLQDAMSNPQVQVPPNAFYFSTDFGHIDGTATSTSTVGASLSPSPPNNIGQYSGKGGGITWENETGGSAPRVIFISRFHPGA